MRPYGSYDVGEDKNKTGLTIFTFIVAVGLISSGVFLISKSSDDSYEKTVQAVELSVANWTAVHRAILNDTSFSVVPSVGGVPLEAVQLFPRIQPDDVSADGRLEEIFATFEPLQHRSFPSTQLVLPNAVPFNTSTELQLALRATVGSTGEVFDLALSPVKLFKSVIRRMSKKNASARTRCLYTLKGEYDLTTGYCTLHDMLNQLCYQVAETTATPTGWTTDTLSGSGGCQKSGGSWSPAVYSKLTNNTYAHTGAVSMESLTIEIRSSMDPRMELVRRIGDGFSQLGEDSSELLVAAIILVLCGLAGLVMPVVRCFNCIGRRSQQRREDIKQVDKFFTGVGLMNQPSAFHAADADSASGTESDGDKQRERMSSLAARRIAALQKVTPTTSASAKPPARSMPSAADRYGRRHRSSVPSVWGGGEDDDDDFDPLERPF